MYVQSVTEEEVKNGIIYNPACAKQAIFFSREYININLKHPEANKFVDMIGSLRESISIVNFTYFIVLIISGPNEDTEAVGLLKQLKQQVAGKLPKESIYI